MTKKRVATKKAYYVVFFAVIVAVLLLFSFSIIPALIHPANIAAPRGQASGGDGSSVFSDPAATSSPTAAPSGAPTSIVTPEPTPYPIPSSIPTPIKTETSESTQFTFTDGNGNTKTPTPINYTSPPRKQAGPESQFEVEIAYAYVGPVPPDKASHYSASMNQTMVHASQFPSAVFLSVTSAPSIQISSCDAVVQVYEVKITADTGATECYAWSIGTNYTTIPQEDIHLLLIGEDDLVGHDLYRREGGIFLNMWETNQSLLSPKIGSIGVYTSNRTGGTINIGLSSAGMPNAISVEVRRIGYVTVTNGSVALYEDAISANEPVAYAQLSKYEDGFIYNNLVPTEQLSQIDLFDPPS